MYKPTCDCGGHIVALYQCLIPMFPDHFPICAIYLNNQSPCFFGAISCFFKSDRSTLVRDVVASPSFLANPTMLLGVVPVIGRIFW